MAWGDRYANARDTGFIVTASVEGHFDDRYYCDEADTVYITKPPFAKLIMTPNPQFTNVNVTWDVSKSGSATSTIATYNLDFGDSIIPPLNNQPWAGAKTGTVQYTIPGLWNAKLTTVDVLGSVSQPAIVQVNIIDPVPGAFFTGVTSNGVWKTTSAGAVNISNNLTGAWLNIREMWLHPQFKNLPIDQVHLIASTGNGVAYNTSGGVNDWFLVSKADMGEPITAGSETSANLDVVGIAFDPTNWKRVAVYRASTLAAGGLWLYITTDYFQTWNNWQVSV